MRIVIIGGGITGMFSAYYLLKDGHEVTIIDDNSSRVPTSSFNAGLITPSIGAAPTIGLGTIIASYFGRAGPVFISPLELLRNLRWFRIGLQKGLSGYENAMVSLGSKSLALYQQFLADEKVSIDTVPGVLGLFEQQREAKKFAQTSGGRFVDDSAEEGKQRLHSTQLNSTLLTGQSPPHTMKAASTCSGGRDISGMTPWCQRHDSSHRVFPSSAVCGLMKLWKTC